MSLFAPDLYRFFGLGFVGGALFLAATSFDADLAPAAQAAEAQLAAEQVSSEFVITDIEEPAQ